MGAQTLTIVKLGGSHALSPRLAAAVAGIAAAQSPVVIVPGGGPFADAVREAQPRIGFSDAAAHRMALLAMCQYGEALVSLHERLAPAHSLAHIRDVLAAGGVPVWMPWPLTGGLDAVRESWDITSDSLAAWLAARLGATRLLLVKSAEPPASEPEADAETLAQSGIVDPAFPDYARESGVPAWWIGPSAIGQLACIIDGACEYGARIVTTPHNPTENSASS